MLVKCYEDSILREWYSISSENSVLVNDLMSWTPETGLALKNLKTLYQRRSDVAGTILRYATMEDYPSYVYGANGKQIAMFTKMVIELADYMNFSLELVSTETFYGSWNKKDRRWSGLLGKLESQQIDVAVAEVTMTKERMDAFDFACPIVLTRTKLFIREPSGNSVVQWNAYLRAFSINIWIILIIIIIISGLILTYMKMRVNKVCCFTNYLVENHLFVWGIYCQQGLSEFPSSSPLRIAYVSIFFSAVILSAVYSASIISYLTIFSPSLPFHSLPGFVADGTYGLIVIRNSAEHEMFLESEDAVLIRMRRLMKKDQYLPVNDIQAFNQVCHEKVGYYSNGAMRRKLGDLIPCSMAAILTGRIDNLALALTKDNPFTEFINYNILRFQDNGIIQRMKKMYFKKTDKPPKEYDSVGISGIVPLITILLLGIIFSIVLLLAENIYYRPQRFNNPNSDNPYSSREIPTWLLKRKSSRSLHKSCFC